MRRRVVITGMGVVTPLGHSVDDTFAALIAGKSGIARTTHFDARTFPTTFAAEVKGFDLAMYLPATASLYADSGSNTLFALAAAKQAIVDSGLLALAGLDPTRVGVYMGTGEGSEDFHAVIAGFRYGFIGATDGSLIGGALFLLAINAVLWTLCYWVLRTGWRLKA